MPIRDLLAGLDFFGGRGLTSRGGGASSSSSSSITGLRLGMAFFGVSSPTDGIRSLGSRRRSAIAAARPKRGSLRPPLFFRPHAIHRYARDPPFEPP